MCTGGVRCAALTLTVTDGADALTVTLTAEFTGAKAERDEDCREETEISRAVLETLVPHVALHEEACGCISRIDLTLPKAVRMGA